MLKGLSAEAGNEIEALYAWRWADEGIRVRRHFVETGPRVRDSSLLQRRQPADGDFNHARQEIPSDGGVERRRLVGIAHAEQHARALAMKVERGLEVDDHDARRWHSARGLRDEDVAPVRIH